MASDKFHKSVTVDTEFLLLRVTSQESAFLFIQDHPPTFEGRRSHKVDSVESRGQSHFNLSRSTYLPLKNPYTRYIDPCNDTFTLHLARGSRNGHYSSATSSSRAPYQFDWNSPPRCSAATPSDIQFVARALSNTCSPPTSWHSDDFRRYSRLIR